ncbi:hypothetical protein SEVIR_9G453500v4 [Setaria viridis]|uniref:C2H2-type domain-containing protein n=1 Tax=Setaria viridis TaxID=4556 RepID=A0A4U6T536_SETVI|nr:zinc finger protein ZAT11 [Setaria viridis]TKV96809.1 hypothetical protein SEVIR_9G453500v2 [Setaria viridis]
MAYGKRSRQQAEEMVRLPDGADVASFLLLFSGHHYQHHASSPDPASAPERVFECKTCNRQFPSFQALGGHRASHKKPRTADGGAAAEPPKPKVHGCSICGLEFAIGQALGGHMRRHRAAEADGGSNNGLGLGLSLGSGLGQKDGGRKVAPAAEVVLDLNAVPEMEEEPDRAKLGLSVEFPVAVVDFLR